MKVRAEREGPLRSGKVKLKLKKVEEIPRVTWEGVWWGIGEVAAIFFFGETASFCMCQVITSLPLKLCRFGAYLATKKKNTSAR